MNVTLWVLCGGAIGWIGFAVFHANAQRGLVVSIVLGATGGLLGGKTVAPLLGTVIDASNAFSPFSLVVAAAVATACLVIASLLASRYGV